LAESQELFERAAVPKLIWVVQGARHQDFLDYDREGYEAHVLAFLIEALRPAESFL
jgi:hypothetical protein